MCLIQGSENACTIASQAGLLAIGTKMLAKTRGKLEGIEGTTHVFCMSTRTRVEQVAPQFIHVRRHELFLVDHEMDWK